MVLDGKSSEEHPVNADGPQGFILGSTLFLPYINDLPGDVTYDIAIYVNTTFYSKCDQAFDLCQQLELVFELESDLQDTMNWSNKYLVDFNVGNTYLVLFDHFNNTGAIGWVFLEEASSFKMLGLTFSSRFD